ncbi:MAG: RNA methyltransferase [Chitinophagaceae bacterium]|nr:MAG: RNA methyltransferase [Chitinophagaceae bacterium]
MTPERYDKMLAVLGRRQADLTVILENVFDPHNVSAVMRSCDAVGIQDVYVLNTRVPHYKKWGFKSSSSASKWLTVHRFESVDECLAAVRLKYDRVLCAYLDDNATDLYELDFTGSLALVFGNEIDGVSTECRSLSDGGFIIPQMGIIHSLNISVACAVTLYEALRQKRLGGHYDRRDTALPEKQDLLARWTAHPKQQKP